MSSNLDDLIELIRPDDTFSPRERHVWWLCVSLIVIATLLVIVSAIGFIVAPNA